MQLLPFSRSVCLPMRSATIANAQSFHSDPLPGQITKPPEPITINDESGWEIEEVLASRLYRYRLKYCVK